MVFAKSSTGYEGQYVRMWEDMVEPGLGAAMLVQVCAQVASDYLLLLFMCFPMPRPFPCLFFPADFKVFPSAVTTMAMIQGPGGGRGGSEFLSASCTSRFTDIGVALDPAEGGRSMELT